MLADVPEVRLVDPQLVGVEDRRAQLAVLGVTPPHRLEDRRDELVVLQLVAEAGATGVGGPTGADGQHEGVAQSCSLFAVWYFLNQL